MLSLPSKISVSPTVVPTVAALCFFCLTLYLGHWQQGRAAEKRELQNEFDRRSQAEPIELGSGLIDTTKLTYAKAVVNGEWVAEGQLYIDNKFDHDAVGFHVIAPLRISGTSQIVLVNRGWAMRGAEYPAPPTIVLPSGRVTVKGMLVFPSSKFLELSQATVQGKVWQNLTIDRYQHETGQKVFPLILLQSDPPTPLRNVIERPDARAEKHIEYMLTWYSLAVTVAALWVILNIKLEWSPSDVTLDNGNKK